jgi:site-specific recombinase XerD
MLENLFTYPAVRARHKKAPLFEERDCYLAYRAKDGCAHQTLLRIARELLQIVQVLDIPSVRDVKPEHIKSTADRWARQQCRRGRAHTLKWSRRLFIQVATDWLHFLGRLDQPTVAPPSFEGFLKDFADWMDSERGLSLRTIHNYSWHVKKFLRWCENHNQSVYTVKISDVDTFLASCGNDGWNRVSVASAAKALKAFFRCAEKCGWPLNPIASAIQGPRLFSQENLPCGPAWEDVSLMIDHLNTDSLQDIRDRAIILLFAVYGLRSSEVSRLILEDIDWENKKISVYRPKQRRTQIYPLTPIVGNAIIRYLKYVRPKSFFHEVFLTLKAPIKYLSAGGLYNIVHRCMSNIGLHPVHRGPHALRHACAMHLVTEGLTIKEIGDHLGHRSTSATRIYAKVNLPQLRLVADVDLGGLS